MKKEVKTTRVRIHQVVIVTLMSETLEERHLEVAKMVKTGGELIKAVHYNEDCLRVVFESDNVNVLEALLQN